MGSSFSKSSCSSSSSSSSWFSSSSCSSSSSSSGGGGAGGGGGIFAKNCRALMRPYDYYAGSQARIHHSSDFSDPESLVDHLQPGDMVQTKGNFVLQWFYSHFAVYIGNGDIIHIVQSGPAERGKLVDVFRGQLVRKNNTHDDVMQPQPRSKIVLEARDWLTKHWSYNAITNNCEHFATMCRYGKKISLQALGMGDVVTGRVGIGEYLYQNVGRSVKQACSTFCSWAKREVLGSVAGIASGFSSVLGIEY